MSLRVCSTPGCGALVKPGVTRCKQHGEYSPTYRARQSSRAERTRRSDTVSAWVAEHGWLCPGWNREPHESHDMTAAHVTAAKDGGADGELSVLCRSCNSREARADG